MHEVVTPREAPTDEAAARRQFEALVAEHRPALLTRAKELCRSHFDPEDLVQDAVERALRTNSPVTDLARLRSWLLTILTNAFTDLARKRQRQPSHTELDEEMPLPEPSKPEPWERISSEDVRAAIGRLTDDVRDTYRMFALEGRDYAAISAKLGIRSSTVGTRIHRARKQLRVLLASEVDGREGEEQ